jgi:hypothetical protein
MLSEGCVEECLGHDARATAIKCTREKQTLHSALEMAIPHASAVARCC